MTIKPSEVSLDGTAVHQQLTDLLAMTLYIDRDEVDPDQPFTESGLDSILAVEYVTTIRSELKMQITVATLYETKTLRGLVEFVTACGVADDAA